jgi:hypothetical protein
MSRFSKHQYSREEIRIWFKTALGRSDPKPSAVVLNSLARSFQIELNRADNAELKRLGAKTLFRFKDESPGAILEEKIGRISLLAKQMLDSITELEDFSGGYIWRYPTRDIELDEVRRLVSGLAYFAGSQETGASLRRGQPPVPWRAAARHFCFLVRDAMQEIGYRGRLSLTDPESVPVIVGAAAITWAYDRPISPAGFVSAMRDRNRAKKK